ncbi:hypothetical protein, variant [Verruconis gallopava]|uniref:Zinc finger PHD-type domain-containing protein n=1 Tax=Verruconis gallopava TaxID=253628 RepID=A0A0D2B0C9_9PEZI|nr:uncharacterized protein PV09_04016 [Verruconis gallopava]XP_016214703.1 hypothetical protein, variant [Verruconis gallopava]KIW04833.1 hypothetical protein PV09_04016 [Verruconis gallopava]KIW04834.1 hypothetical protein, variant [Verruconis gallopava]
MNVGPSIHGLPDWHFPSPTSTPRSSALEQAPFQTPKCEPPSHFLDAFYTPRATGHQTPAATPVVPNDSTIRLLRSPHTSPLTPQDPQFHVNHYKVGHLPLPPVDPARRLSSTPDSVKSSDNLKITIVAPGSRQQELMEPFHLQTPPPTRDSSARREYAVVQSALATTPGQMQPPGSMQTPIRQQQQQMTQQTPQFQTPAQLTQLQFSPAMFQVPESTQASTSTLPNERFSWDTQSPSFSFANEAMMSTQEGAFGQPHSMSPHFAQWQTPNLSGVSSQTDMQHSYSQPSQGADFWTTPTIHSQQVPSFSDTSSFASTVTTAAVDPSMISSFSSPRKVDNASPVRPHITPQKIDTALRQPYEHQTMESNREKELAKKAKQMHNRSSAGSASISFGRPGLQRSNTDSGFRRPKLGFGDGSRASQLVDQVERRPSPLKRHSQLLLSAIPEAVRSRPKTRLVIDEDGRARTETVETSDGLRNSQRGFDLWDDSSSDEEIVPNSQRNSFGMNPGSLQRRSSKHARTGSDTDRYDPNKRPVSSASISSLASRLETTPLGKRSSKELNYRRFSSDSFSGSISTNNISPNKEDKMMNDGTDAQAALKRIMESRPRRQEFSDSQAILDAHNQRWSQASIDLAKLSAIQEQATSYDPFGSTGNSSLSPTSGTDADILTPSTERSSRSTESTRCVCSATEIEGQLMIQCESCNKWLHVRCVGLDPHRLPPVYVCVYCTGTTPLARGGRIRDPLRRGEASHVSPLGYKSVNSLRR